MSETQPKTDRREKWTVYAPEKDSARHFDDRPEAEAKRDELADLLTIELHPPGELPEALVEDTSDGETDEQDGACEDNTVPCEECGESVTPGDAEFDAKNNPYHPGCYGDDGEPVDAEIVETDTVEVDNPEPVDTEDLPEKTLSEDPLNWVPGHFVDEIEGVPTINRKGYAVIAEHYDISVTAEVVTSPGESDFQYAEFRATATTPDGTEYTGWGSAHVDRGDDKTLLAEMAETRAMKRATAWATGIGMTAVEELRSEVQEP